MQSVEIGLIASALAKAQANIHCPPRNREVKVKTRAGDTYKFAYTTFDQIIEAVRGPLTSNGIWFVQSYDEWDDDPAVMTTLVHSSGQWFSTTTPMFLEERPTNQAFGSAFTYSRRYGLSAALGLSSEEDDDANSADGNQAEGKDRQKPKFDTVSAPISEMPQRAAAEARKFMVPVDPKTGTTTPHLIKENTGVVEWGGIFIAAIDQATSLHEVLAWEKLNQTYLDEYVKIHAPKVYNKVLTWLVNTRNKFGSLPSAEKGDIVVADHAAPKVSNVAAPLMIDLSKALAACKTKKGIETAWANKQTEIDKLAPADFDSFAKLFEVHLDRVAPRKQ